MSLLDNMSLRQLLDNDVSSSSRCDGKKSDAERLSELLAAFELSNSVRQDKQLNTLSTEGKHFSLDSRVPSVSPPPGFPQLPSSSPERTMWQQNKALVSRNNSDVFPVDNQQLPTSPYNSVLSNYAQVEHKMLNELALLQRFMERSTTAASMRSISPELARFLAELDAEGSAGSSGGAPLARYKTELCRPFEEHGACKYGDKCQFAHGRQELRSLSRHPKYKTDLCKTYHTTGFCPYGPRCHFIHNDEEAAFNRAGLERQRLERELKERFEAFKKQQQQQQRQLLQQQQALLQQQLLGNIEQRKLATHSGSSSSSNNAPLRSSDFFVNSYSGLDNIRNVYDSLDSLSDRLSCSQLSNFSSSSSSSSSKSDSLSSSPSLLMFGGGGDEINNSLNSLISLGSAQSTCTSFDSLSSSGSSPPTISPQLSLNNSHNNSPTYPIQNTLPTSYASNSNFGSLISNVPATFSQSTLDKNQATPGYGRFASSNSESRNASNNFDFINSKAAQQEIFRLAMELAKSMTTSASSSTMVAACGEQRPTFQPIFSATTGITL